MVDTVGVGVIEGGVGVLVRVAVDEDVAVDVAVAELVDVALAGLERVPVRFKTGKATGCLSYEDYGWAPR